MRRGDSKDLSSGAPCSPINGSTSVPITHILANGFIRSGTSGETSLRRAESSMKYRMIGLTRRNFGAVALASCLAAPRSASAGQGLIALNGFDAVSYFLDPEGQPVAGKATYEWVWKNRTWRFSKASNSRGVPGCAVGLRTASRRLRSDRDRRWPDRRYGPAGLRDPARSDGRCALPVPQL